MFKTLIDAPSLSTLQAGPAPAVLLDCRFDLVDPAAGERAYAQGHLPGAHYAHMDRDLAAPKHPAGPRSAAYTGRHPLPSLEQFARTLGAWGIGPQTQVVVYDAQGGTYAGRAWWMLRWVGHQAVALLDGGLEAWTAAGGRLETGGPGASATAAQDAYPVCAVAAVPVVDAATLERELGRVRVIDARTAERWRGENETLDPVGGHIPGSTSRFFRDNLGPDGRFKSADQLRAEFAALGVSDGAGVVHQCGSGVTACHNLLAMEHAGLTGSALYPGSWSEWCADASRPVARG